MGVTLYLIFMWVPMDAEQKDAQRIFYFHVPMAWVAFLAFFGVFVGSVVYLWKRDVAWDRFAYCSGEIGVVFTFLVLMTGSIWAKPIWGAWWTWDPRLTTTAMLLMIYISYLLIRAYAAQDAQAARFGAVVGIVGFVDVPIVYMSIRWWRTMHPAPVIGGGPDSGLDVTMLATLLVSVLAFTLFYLLLLRQRMAIKKMEHELEGMRYELEMEDAEKWAI
ncbi:MAG: cytochrome c biogenesis protein CcsA [Chloroflexi bacterium]|nr:cytochrome c biogenesis protein CcsA [Chloroflexota bacterium]